MKGSLKKQIELKLNEMVLNRCAPGFQLCLGFRKETLGLFTVGYRDPKSKEPVTSKTWFDLSSLTKILSTVPLVMLAYQKQQIKSLDETLKTFFPFFSSSLKDTPIRTLLNHRSSLPPTFQDLSESSEDREERLRYLLRSLDSNFKPSSGDRIVYSDVNFMLLGALLEQSMGNRLREIFNFIKGVRDGGLSYGPIDFRWEKLSRWLSIDNVAGILAIDEPNLWLKGIVQDPRAQWLMGDAGHAGLFGTALGVENLLKEIYFAYHGKSTWLSDKVVREFVNFEQPYERFLNGFDTPTQSSEKPSQAGSLASTTTIGHLGYTGCSCWMDVERGVRIVLLSHRHAPGFEAEKLSNWRPVFHDWLYQEVFSKLKA